MFLISFLLKISKLSFFYSLLFTLRPLLKTRCILNFPRGEVVRLEYYLLKLTNRGAGISRHQQNGIEVPKRMH